MKYRKLLDSCGWDHPESHCLVMIHALVFMTWFYLMADQIPQLKSQQGSPFSIMASGILKSVRFVGLSLMSNTNSCSI